MADVTLAEANAHLAVWMAADLAVAQGQSYSIADRQLTRTNSAEIRKNVDYWRSMVSRLSSTSGGSGPRVSRVIPRDM